MAVTTSASEKRGIQSLEIGLRLFQAVHRLGRPVTLNELAKISQMPPSKAHRYCVSLIRTGMLRQDGRGLYGIGPYGFQLSHLNADLDNARTLALGALPALVREIGETVFLSAWGEKGPRILRVADTARPISIRPTMEGDIPMHNSGTGRLFAAYMPEDKVSALLDEEFVRVRSEQKVTVADARARKVAFLKQLADVRRRRMARTTGERYPGLLSFSVPIFDRQGGMILALTAFGLAATFSSAWDGTVPRALQACGMDLTRQIGGRAP